MKVIPVGDKIVVRNLSDEEKMTENDLGIILPDSMKKDNDNIVYIESVGPDVKNKALVKGVQVMLVGLMMKQTIEYDNFKGQLIKEGDIVAIIE